MLLAVAGSTVAFWPYKVAGEWKGLHSFKAPITCMQQSATEPRLLAVGCADASLHLFDMLLCKVGRQAWTGCLQLDPCRQTPREPVGLRFI